MYSGGSTPLGAGPGVDPPLTLGRSSSLIQFSRHYSHFGGCAGAWLMAGVPGPYSAEAQLSQLPLSPPLQWPCHVYAGSTALPFHFRAARLGQTGSSFFSQAVFSWLEIFSERFFIELKEDCHFQIPCWLPASSIRPSDA